MLIDAANLKPGQTGIRSYTLSLLAALSRCGELSLRVLTSDPASFHGMNVEVLTLPERTRALPARMLWRDAALPRLVRRTRSDVVLVNTFEAPFRATPFPVAVILHDVGGALAPGIYGWKRWARWLPDTVRLARRADAILSVSESSLRDLMALTQAAGVKGRVIGSGSSPQITPVSAASSQSEPFFLYAGTLYRHKNIETLIEAAAVLKRQGLEARVVLVGPISPRERCTLESQVRRCRAEGVVEHLGYVDPGELAGLLGACRAFVFPSLYEGFGMPVVDAMRAGVPCVVSSIPALREVGRDAVLYVEEPRSPEAWAEALAQFIPDTGPGADLVNAGLRRSSEFSWDSVADRVSAALHQVAGSRQSGRGCNEAAEAVGVERDRYVVDARTAGTK